MTLKEAKRLQVGDRVVWKSDNMRGIVSEILTHGICVDYADGYKQQGLTFTDAATYLEKARSKK